MKEYLYDNNDQNAALSRAYIQILGRQLLMRMPNPWLDVSSLMCGVDSFLTTACLRSRIYDRNDQNATLFPGQSG